MIPNIVIHPLFGKVLFAVLDLVAAFLIHRILALQNNVKNTQFYVILFLFNPLVFNMSTRGSADIMICLLVFSEIDSIHFIYRLLFFKSCSLSF